MGTAAYMSKSMTREVGLLRTLTTHLEKRHMPFQQVTQGVLRREKLGHAQETPDGIIAIRMPGHQAFSDLADCLLDRLPTMERGTIHADVQNELFNFIKDYVGRDASCVGSKDAEALIGYFENWFANESSTRRVFIPCLISPTDAPRFVIGPVTFEFINRITISDFYPCSEGDTELDLHGFDKLLEWMRGENANWLARVSVDGCGRKRAEEIAELSVDLAIVALQLAAPFMHTSTMSRLDARRGTSQKRMLSEANGYYSAGWTRKEPGLTIGQGTLHDILQKAAPIFKAVGNVVHSFASGSFRLPVLERAWCDAAYWLHQALAEPIDTIAIAKFETALEVLFRAENSKGSEQRMLEILNAFFDLKQDDPIAPGSSLSSRQFARNVVRDRSRILHGTWSTLNARGINRAGMEGFVVTVLRTAVTELENYAQSEGPVDDSDVFLGWMTKKKMVPSA